MQKKGFIIQIYTYFQKQISILAFSILKETQTEKVTINEFTP